MTQAQNIAELSSDVNSSGVLQPAGGGTGATTLTANSVLLGNGTSAVQTVAPGTNGNVLTSNGTTWSSSTPAAGTTFSAGTTGFTPNTASSGAVTLAGTLAIANGGTGSTSAANALTALGAYASSNPSSFINQAGARTAVSFTAGSGAYNNSTGVFTIPTNTNQLTNGAGFTTNTGTVTSVNLTGGTAISVSGGPITSSGSITVNNTGVTSVSAGTGISVSASTGGVTITNSSPNQLTTTTGSPAYYGARAWVNFNGTGTVAIRASVNVSSITDRGTGYYTTNFSTAMPDANYAAAGWVSDRSFGATISNVSGGFASGSHQFFTCQEINGPTFDPETVCVSYLR